MNLAKLPNKGANLLPAIAMLPEEHSTSLVKQLGLHQKRLVDRLKLERDERPISDCSKAMHTYSSSALEQFSNTLSLQERLPKLQKQHSKASISRSMAKQSTVPTPLIKSPMRTMLQSSSIERFSTNDDDSR